VLHDVQVIIDIQKHVRHPALHWIASTLDGRIQGNDAVFEAKFMLPWSFSEEAAAEKYMPQLQQETPPSSGRLVWRTCWASWIA
jgi:hypothetical protein